MLTILGQHHPRADNDHLYILRKEGGRVQMQIGVYEVKVINLMEYKESKEDPLLQYFRTHQHHTNSTLF
jgi:hypothetical protein